MCWFCVSTGETHSSQQAIFSSHSKQNEKMNHIWHIAYQGLPKYQIRFPLSKVSEPWKFQMCWLCVSRCETLVQNSPSFSLMPNWLKKWVIFDTMAYQRLLKSQISFLLFRVSEPWKFQMSSFWFCLSTSTTGETGSSKQAIFSLMPNRMTNWVILDILAYQGLRKYQISFPLFKVSEPWKF